MYTKKYSIAICCIILQSMLLLNTTHVIIRIQTLHYESLKYIKARVIPPNKNVQVRQVGAGGPLPPSIAFAHSCWTRNGIAWKEPELQLAEAFLGSATWIGLLARKLRGSGSHDWIYFTNTRKSENQFPSEVTHFVHPLGRNPLTLSSTLGWRHCNHFGLTLQASVVWVIVVWQGDVFALCQNTDLPQQKCSTLAHRQDIH